jgi:4-aminobutyrate aminotransferase-like enzyme
MNTRQTLDTLQRYESRNVTLVEPDGSWPIVWARAKGSQVWDAEGRRYLDLTAAFGVAAAGHANPRVVQAGQRQMARLPHAMGDVHPHELKARLARELSHLTFERWERRKISKFRSQISNSRQAGHGKVIFCNSGFEAVEAALKTALLATGKPGIIAFAGAYHGLGYGTLNATHRNHFRGPFRSQLREFGHFLPFPCAQASAEAGNSSWQRTLGEGLERAARKHNLGAVLVEPIQARGGIRIPPADFLPWLQNWCSRHDALLIVDEIYTGFGRTGKWFACEHGGVTPDLVCLGKALTGGFPLSACVGRAALMDQAWPASTGEAIHTSTFLGNPVGCAMALAQIGELRRRQLVPRSDALGNFLVQRLRAAVAELPLRLEVRGRGLMVGVEVNLPDGSPATAVVLRTIKELLHGGFIFLPEGEHANVLAFTPPLTITRAQLTSAIDAVGEVLSRVAADFSRRQLRNVDYARTGIGGRRRAKSKRRWPR